MEDTRTLTGKAIQEVRNLRDRAVVRTPDRGGVGQAIGVVTKGLDEPPEPPRRTGLGATSWTSSKTKPCRSVAA